MKLSGQIVDVVCIGAGPAGLTAAYALAKDGVKTLVLEADAAYVGGIAKTVTFKGYSFDIGGHRFFSKSQEIEDLWTEILPNDMLVRPRSSRIYYRNKFFSYPLKPLEAFFKLGPVESVWCVFSYFLARLRPIRNARNFRDWVSNEFGNRLFSIFFKTYTEKVWGMDCSEISADWAAQRIKGLSLWTAVRNSIFKSTISSKGDVVKSLIETFRYPRLGPGMLWNACAEKIRQMGGRVELGVRVESCEYDSSSALWNIRFLYNDGVEGTVGARNLVSTMPLRELVTALKPAPSVKCIHASEALKYRDFLTVVVILKQKNVFEDNWLYIHDSSVKVGRIQNFKSWSPDMVPNSEMACLGLEYFCFENDSTWTMTDDQLLLLAKSELAKIGIASPQEILDGCVVRQLKAYPVYDDNYRGHVAAIRDELEQSFPTLHTIGRNGMHKYNNQDHAMMTALLTAKNILAKRKIFDVWKVNQDAEYHEQVSLQPSGAVSGLRMVPERVARDGAGKKVA